MQFEWDERKNTANKKKHGLSFEAALFVFEDPFLLSKQDERFGYNEERWKSIGLIGRAAIVVAHTFLEGINNEEEIIRIISARKATTREEGRYYFYRSHSERN